MKYPVQLVVVVPRPSSLCFPRHNTTDTTPIVSTNSTLMNFIPNTTNRFVISRLFVIPLCLLVVLSTFDISGQSIIIKPPSCATTFLSSEQPHNQLHSPFLSNLHTILILSQRFTTKHYIHTSIYLPSFHSAIPISHQLSFNFTACQASSTLSISHHIATYLPHFETIGQNGMLSAVLLVIYGVSLEPMSPTCVSMDSWG